MATRRLSLDDLLSGITAANEAVSQKEEAAEVANNDLVQAAAEISTKRSQAEVAIRNACRQFDIPFINPDEIVRINANLETALREKNEVSEQLQTVSEQLQTVTHERDDLRNSLTGVQQQLTTAQQKLDAFAQAGFNVEEDNSPQGNGVAQPQGRRWGIF